MELPTPHAHAVSLPSSHGQPNTIALAQALIRCASETPTDDGVMAEVGRILRQADFQVDCFESVGGGNTVLNLIASRGRGEPVLAFAGHVDVVPPGAAEAWTQPAFSGQLVDGKIYGRGAVDMKGALAAFLTAATRSSHARGREEGTLLVLLTGDEENGSPQGMRALLERMRQTHTPAPEACLIGEPSCEGFLGQGIRIGRRGSLNVRVQAAGVQGHVAWPHRARNAMHLMVDFLAGAKALDLGGPEGCFPPSNLEVTQVGSDSHVSNLIPGQATATMNLRFNRQWSGAELCTRLQALAEEQSPHLRLTFAISGEPYLAENIRLSRMVADASRRVTGHTPDENAGGGVSDGRFIRHLCPVVEFGLVGDLAHKVDECVDVRDLLMLEQIYRQTIAAFFSDPGAA